MAITPKQDFKLPTVRIIIQTELARGLAVADVAPEEMNDFVDYVLLANCGAAPFYLPGERSMSLVEDEVQA